MKKPTIEDMKRHQVMLLVQKIGTHANESMLYLDGHFKRILKDYDKNSDMWENFNVFLHHYNHLIETNRQFAEMVTGIKTKKESEKEKCKKN